MARAIDADKIEWYDDEQGFEIAYKVDIDAQPTVTPPNELMEALEAINNAAVAYIEGGPYENDLPGMELAVEINRLSRDCVRPPNEPRAGLYGKYTVYKNKDGSLVTDCFILRPAKDPAAVAALRAYAATTDNAELAADIINWVGAEPNEPLSIEQLRGMKDEPAYLNVFDPLLKSGWHIIKAVTEDKIIFRGWEKIYVPIDGMGIDYNLYRRPPEGEA